MGACIKTKERNLKKNTWATEKRKAKNHCAIALLTCLCNLSNSFYYSVTITTKTKPQMCSDNKNPTLKHNCVVDANCNCQSIQPEVRHNG